MTAESQTDASADVQTQSVHEKDVVLTVYGSPDYEDARSFVDDVFGDQLDDDASMQDMEVVENDVFKIELDLEAEDPQWNNTKQIDDSMSLFPSSHRRALRNAIEEGQIDPDAVDWINVVDTVETDEEYVHQIDNPIDDYLTVRCDEMSTPVDLGYEEPGFPANEGEWSKEVPVEGPDAEPDESQMLKCTVSGPRPSDVQRRRTLVHQENRSADNRYEEDQDVDQSKQPWSFQVTVDLEATAGDELDELSDGIVGELYRDLATIDGVQKLRLTDCERTVRERGECFNI